MEYELRGFDSNPKVISSVHLSLMCNMSSPGLGGAEVAGRFVFKARAITSLGPEPEDFVAPLILPEARREVRSASGSCNEAAVDPVGGRPANPVRFRFSAR